MVNLWIVLGHKSSHLGMELDKAKIEVISKSAPLDSIKVVRSSLGHYGLHRRFLFDI